jgi:hypothetical protein
MSVAEMCALAQLSRVGCYRFLATPTAGDKDIDLRDTVQRLALEFPPYGRPRITAELLRRGGRIGCPASSGRTTCYASGGANS